jgi:mannose-6-phosphate isomerase-like protein (cupin superfamily)
MPYTTSVLGAVAEPLRGDRGVSHKLLNPSTGCAGLVLQVNVISAGVPAGPYHFHTNSDNIYYVLDGQGLVTVDGRAYEMAKDDAILVYANEKHQIMNIGTSELKFIECKVPAESDFIIVE